jgi:cell division protein FtsA
MLEVRTFEDTTRLVSRDEINEVMAARLDQLLGLVADEVRRSGYEGLLPAGVVLTGGVAAMPGIEGLAQGKLRMPVRVGHPKHVGGLADAFENPAYATTVGLTLWGLKHEAVNVGAGLRKGPAQQKARAGFGFFVDWLKNFDPNK